MSRLLNLWLFAAVVLLSGSVMASAEEWSRFRGPNGTGESEATTIPEKWTMNDVNWDVKLSGVGNSSPIVWGKRLFVLSADPVAATRYVSCYDAITGGRIWERHFESEPYHIHKQSSFASSTPAVDAEFLYVTWATPAHTTIMALTHDGEDVWAKDLGPWFSQHGFGASPMVADDIVVLSCSYESFNGPETVTPPESFIVAFDRKTGNERWRTPRKTAVTSYSTPAIFQPRNGPPQIVSTSTGNGMFALDPKDGKELWSSVLFDKRTVSSPLIKGDIIVGSTGSGPGGNYLVAARSDGGQPTQIYKIDTQAPYVPASVARGNLLFLLGDAGFVACVELETGNLQWRKRIGGNYSSSPVRAHDKLICVSSDGEVVVLAAEKEFRELNRVSLGEISRATPAIANGSLYLRTASRIISVGGTTSKSSQP